MMIGLIGVSYTRDNAIQLRKNNNIDSFQFLEGSHEGGACVQDEEKRGPEKRGPSPRLLP